MKKYLFIVTYSILLFSFSNIVFAGTCTDRGFSVTNKIDTICTTAYDNCTSNYTSDMALPSEVPFAINLKCSELIGSVQSYDIKDAAYCMKYTLLSPESPLPDSRNMEYCFAAQSCIADEWQILCDETAKNCCQESTEVVVDNPTQPVVPTTPNIPSVSTPIDPSNGFTYTNNDYGFSLTLPQEWSTYLLLKSVDDNIIHFGFSMRNGTEHVTLFEIGITTNGITPVHEEYLGENSSYKFSFSHLNGEPPSNLVARVLELDEIKNSFNTHIPNIIAIPTTTNTLVFNDIIGHKYKDAITYVKKEAIVKGYSDGNYKPDNPINRAEFIKIIMESGFDKSVFGGSNCFSDVGTEWFAEYVCAAKNLSVIKGYSDGSFGANNSITLVEALKIIFESASILSGDTIIPVQGPWYQTYLDLANSLNLLNTINPAVNHNLTRGEMAELIYMIDKL